VPGGPDLPPGPDVVEPPNCLDGTLDPAWGAGLVSASTLEADESFEGSCGGALSKDLAYGWEVPFSDWFVLDTAGSDFDTVLYVLASCTGHEIACNNDLRSDDATSRIVRRFQEGDRHVVVLDGNAGSRGNVTLNIQPVQCPNADVGDGATLPQPFSTAVGTAEHAGDCGGDGPERSFRFTPPETGLWRISATPDTTPGESLRPALYVERGPICGGPLLQCNGHDHGGIGMPSEVTRVLPAGEPVTIFVDSRGDAGSFVLDAKKIGDGCPSVPSGDITFEEGLDIQTFGDTMTTSCGENADIEWGTFRPYPDILVVFEDDEPGTSTSCTVDVDAGFPFSMAFVRGECAGAEVFCARSEPQPDGRSSLMRRLPKLGGKLTLVISPTSPSWGGWQDSIARIAMFCVAK